MGRSYDKRITGIIHTKNEEAYIEQAVRSLAALTDDVIVADMESNDRTVELATGAGAQVVRVPDFGYLEPALAIAESHAAGEWVMRLDADEILPRRLAGTLRAVADRSDVDAVVMSFRNYFFGTELKYAGWGPEHDRHLRFYRRSAVTVRDVPIHGVIRHDPERTLVLPADPDNCIVHFNYLDWSHFLRKMDRYTTVEAEEYIRAHGRAPTLRSTFWKLSKEAGFRIVHGRALADGMRGLTLTVLMVTYRLLTHVKAAQALTMGDAEAVRSCYREIARRELEA